MTVDRFHLFKKFHNLGICDGLVLLSITENYFASKQLKNKNYTNIKMWRFLNQLFLP